jgi:hypothetical protein
MRALVVIPSVADRQPLSACRPRRDYAALCESLKEAGAEVELLDFAAAGVKSDLKLALAAHARRKDFDAIYVNAESLGVPLALLGSSPKIVCMGHPELGASVEEVKAVIGLTGLGYCLDICESPGCHAAPLQCRIARSSRL